RESELGMRMDRRSALTAARVVNEFDASELARVFRRYGDERFAGRISRAIETRRRRAPLRTTTELAALIEGAVPMRTGRIHPATRVFQALRIVVNDEYGVLERGLEAAWRVLKVGGRLVVISFHSGEARIVKEFGRTLSRNYEVEGDVDEPEFRRPRPPRLRNLTRSPVMPGEKEQKRNPKARSAQMRVFEKIYAP
ncbi:MAG: 16S rRNA (cytosine(1402)-N(4))-methyltransferase RsmH, partial [Verrucomicrobia bacterium]|nr:16S rRNA (cytosine(1402)-N(4))-methyltransferase RsmH [Verrucomicrobiota bacterium]